MKHFLILSAALTLTACQPQIETALPPDGEMSAQMQAETLPAQTVPVKVPPVKAAPAKTPLRPAAFQIRQSVTPFPLKRCVNLGNSLESPSEGEWGYVILERDLRNIKRAGFDSIRLPVRWDTHMARRAPYAVDPAYIARVAQVVSQAQNAGLGVVLDVHHYEALVENPRSEARRFYALWTQISEYFADAPQTVYFELLNEPLYKTPMKDVNTLYVNAVKIIRKTNPNRIIIAGGNSWNSIDTIGDVDWSGVGWPRDPNIVATYHDYGPHEFTHQGATWSEPVMPLGRKWGGKADENEFKLTFDQAAAFKAKTGLRLFVGEFSVINKAPLAERNAWTEARRKAIEAQGTPWCVWDYSASFNIYDLETETWLPGALDALMGR